MTERSDLRKELAEEEKASDEAYADLKAAPEPKPSYLLQRYDECRQRVLRLQDRIAFKGASQKPPEYAGLCIAQCSWSSRAAFLQYAVTMLPFHWAVQSMWLS